VSKDTPPLVSFIVVAYNQDKYIKEAVLGAFSQTYQPLEIILSDDGSSDLTFEIMQDMVEKYVGPHKIILNIYQKIAAKLHF
jgi:glycosyltransferase involved in cell wall biosynthesis